MTTELERELHRSVADLTLDTSPSEVLARGNRMRRRRRLRSALGATSFVAVTALAATVVAHQPGPGAGPGPGPGEAIESPGVAAFQVASWSGPDTNLSATQLGEVRAACAKSASHAISAAGLREPGWLLPSSTPPVAAELRDQVVLTYFREGRDYATCALKLTDAGRFRVVAQSAGRERVLPAGRSLAFVTAGAADPGRMGGTLSRVHAVLQTSPEVARVEIEVAGETYASTPDAVAFFWIADGLNEANLAQASVTAFDADGEILSRTKGDRIW